MSVLSTGCFGKLPDYDDFIRHKASGKEIILFDKWIQEGVYLSKQRLGDKWKEYFTNAPCYHFLFHFGESSNILAGVFSPSYDRVGRGYPFIIFVVLESPILKNHIVNLPSISASFFRCAKDIIEDGKKGIDLKELISRIDNLEIYIPSQVDSNSLKEIKNRELWCDLFGEFEDIKKYQIFQSLMDILTPLQKGNYNQLKWGIRFPLPKTPDTQKISMIFYMELIYKIINDYSMIPSILWNNGEQGEEPLFLIFFSTPLSINFVTLIRHDFKNEMIYDLLKDGSKDPEDIMSRIKDGHKDILRDKDISMIDFLKKV